MRTLQKHGYIRNFVVAYRCSDCERVFRIPVQQKVTGVISGPPREVLEAFEKHDCAETRDSDKA